MGGAVQGGAAGLVGRVDVRAQRQDQPDRLQRPVGGHPGLGGHLPQPRRDHQRRGVLVGRGAGVRADAGETAHHLDVGVHRGEQERRGPDQAHPEARAGETELGRRPAQADVRVGPVGQQRIDQSQLAAPQAVERPPFRVGVGVDAAQASGQLGMPGPRRPVQGGIAGPVGVRVRAVLQQRRRQRRMAPHRGHVQRREAVGGRRVHVCAGGQQMPDEGRFVLAGRDQQRREPALRTGGDVRAVFEQHPRDLRVPLAGRVHQGRLAVPGVRRRGIGAVGEQRGDRRRRAGPRAGHQRGLAGPARAVRVGPRREQPGHDARRAVVARQPQRRHPVIVRRVDGGPGPDEQIDEPGVVVIRRPVQGRRAVGPGGVHIDASLDQSARGPGVLRPNHRDQGAAVVPGRPGSGSRGSRRQSRGHPAPPTSRPHRDAHRPPQRPRLPRAGRGTRTARTPL